MKQVLRYILLVPLLAFVACTAQLPEKYSEKEAHEKGINDSIVHEDFMIGTPDLSIIAHCRDGKSVQIFKDGNWAI